MKYKMCTLPGRDKITASPLVGRLLPATANGMNPPHNIVHMALGGRKEIGIFGLLINKQRFGSQCKKGPTPHAPNRYA